jgi:hypothetical protein
MTSAARIYALLLALVLFFLTWATVAAHPWGRTAAPDPRMAALEQRRVALRHEAIRVRRVLERRWAAYRVARANRERLIAAVRQQAAAAPVTRYVSVAAPATIVPSAPVTATRSS